MAGGLRRPPLAKLRYLHCWWVPLLDLILVRWAPGSFWYMTFEPRVAGVCQLFLDNEDIDGVDSPPPSRSDSSHGPLGHHVSLHPLLPHRSSNRPRADRCPNPGLAGDPSRDLIISSRACWGGVGGAYRHQEARNIKATLFTLYIINKFFNLISKDLMFCL